MIKTEGLIIIVTFCIFIGLLYNMKIGKADDVKSDLVKLTHYSDKETELRKNWFLYDTRNYLIFLYSKTESNHFINDLELNDRRFVNGKEWTNTISGFHTDKLPLYLKQYPDAKIVFQGKEYVITETKLDGKTVIKKEFYTGDEKRLWMGE